MHDRRRAAVIAAFVVIYLVWGSTYLAIRVGLETVPPFLLAGGRFVLAGTALYVCLRVRGVPRPADSQWWWAAVTGTLMLVCGVGGVTWAEQKVPSGPAALLAATVPLWMTLIDAALQRRAGVGGRTALGLVLGLGGVAVLIGPSRHAMSAVDSVSGTVIVGGALCWSFGSLLSRRCDLPRSPTMTVSIQMVTGGVALLAVSSALGEWQDGFALADVSHRSALALVYLAVVGSLIAMSAYVWLLRKVSAPAVSTYAFVNPVVAVFLGWGLAGESVGGRVVLASTLIVGAVVLIQSAAWVRNLAASCRGESAADVVPRPARRPLVARTPFAAPTSRPGGLLGLPVAPRPGTDSSCAPATALQEDGGSDCPRAM